MDACLLIDLVMRASNISDEIAKSARELVSLRILEILFLRKNWRDDSTSEAHPKIRIDTSRCCEDVLKQILQEIPMSILKMGRPEMLKWDVQSFVMHKRSCLPKCGLLKLREKFAPLKESSAMSSGNLTPNEYLVSSSQGNGFSKLELLPAKRSKLASSAYLQGGKCRTEQTIPENALYHFTEAAKKHRQDVICLRQNVGIDKVGEHITQQIKREGCSFEKEATTKDLLTSKTLKDDNSMHTAPEKFGQSCDNRRHMQLHHSDIELPQGTNFCIGSTREEPATLPIKTEGKVPRYLPKDSSNVGPTYEDTNSIDDYPEPESYSDSDDYLEEKIDIAKKKGAFLSSQCTDSQVSFSTTDFKELDICLKCNKGGQLLVCSSATCTVLVHDSCLGSVPVLDKAGRFYCPFCAYSRAIYKYLEVKKKTSHARNDLKSFFGLGIIQSSEHLATRSRQNQPQQDELSGNDVTSSNMSSSNNANAPKIVSSQYSLWFRDTRTTIV